MSERRLLLIFDGGAPLMSIDQLRGLRLEAIDLLPLTSGAAACAVAEERSRAAVSQVSQLDAPKRLDDEARRLRTWLPDAIARLGLAPIDGVPLRERLVSPRHPSSWWLTPFAERNPLVSRFITRLGQLRVVEAVLAERRHDSVGICLGALDLRGALQRAARTAGIGTILVTKRSKDGLRRAAAGRLESLKSALILGRLWTQAVQARRRLGLPEAFDPAATAFVTYFPAVDASATEFHDRYFDRLRELLDGGRRPVEWLLLPEPIGGHSYSNAVDLAARFKAAGTKLSTWHQWLSLTAFREAIAERRRMARTFHQFRAPIEAASASIFGVDAQPIVVAALGRSFLGVRACRALVMREAFVEALRHAPRQLVYCAEFQPWEAALCGTAAASRVRTIGFQHTVVPPNMYNYARVTAETAREAPAPMPLPDLVAADGERPAAQLRPGVPNVAIVEAIRQQEILSRAAPAGAKSRLVAVIGSIDPPETRAMLDMLRQAQPLPDIRVVVRLHPASRMSADPRWETSHTAVTELLREAAIAIVPSSSVAVEALAAGCHVIQPLIPDQIATGPLDADEGWHVTVSNGAQLRDAIVMQLDAPARDARALVREFWCEDVNGLRRWRAVLEGTS